VENGIKMIVMYGIVVAMLSLKLVYTVDMHLPCSLDRVLSECSLWCA